VRCVILCGGKGERLMPLTKDVKKAFLPLGDKRVIDHIIDRLPRSMTYSISLNDNGAIAAVAEAATGYEPVMVVCGDNYFSISFDSFQAAYAGETLVGIFEVESLEKAKRFGVVELYAKSTQVKSFAEKPEQPKSRLVSAGLYIFPPHVFGLIQELVQLNPKGNLGCVIGRILEKRPVYGFRLSGTWIDVGTIEGYNSAVSFVNSLDERTSAVREQSVKHGLRKSLEA